MNLNKRGGESVANLAIIKNYTAYYHKEIKREIEIIAPTMIFIAVRILTLKS